MGSAGVHAFVCICLGFRVLIEFSYPLGAELALAATSWPAPRRGAAAAPLETPHADARASPVLLYAQRPSSTHEVHMLGVAQRKGHCREPHARAQRKDEVPRLFSRLSDRHAHDRTTEANASTSSECERSTMEH